MEARVRLPPDQTIGSLSPLELLEKYWEAAHVDPSALNEINQLATQLMREVHGEGNDEPASATHYEPGLFG
jgi:hypothetical protein